MGSSFWCGSLLLLKMGASSYRMARIPFLVFGPFLLETPEVFKTSGVSNKKERDAKCVPLQILLFIVSI
jgi:hypothetical protein